MSQNFTMIPRQALGQDAWNAFVDACDEAWLWHRYELQDAIATWPGKHDQSFAVIDEASEGKIIAVIPLHLIEGRTAKLFSRNILDSLGGPACHNGLTEKKRRNLLEYLRTRLIVLAGERNAVKVCLALSPMAPAYRGDDCPRVNPLLNMGCENTLGQTWVIKLNTCKEDIWNGMEGRARTAIRKAIKEGVQIRPAQSEADLDIYYRLHCQTYHRTGARPRPRAYFEAIWRSFIPQKHAHILFAEHKGTAIAAENFGIYKNAAIYWTGAANDSALPLGANSLLQWTAIQWMMDQIVQWYEIGEAFPRLQNGKLKGLSDFKKSFGGMLYPYYRGTLNTGKKFHKILALSREIF